MNRLICLVAILASLVATTLRAQRVQNTKTPDQKFAELVVANKPASISRSVNGRLKTRDEIRNETAILTQKAREVEAAAREFYSEHPAHPKAVEAKKIEVLAGLRGVRDGDALQLYAAMANARAFRADTKFSPTDRLDVALAVERMDMSQKLKTKRAANTPEERKKIGDNLRREFGNQPAVYSYYMEVARTANMATAREIATDVSNARAAPQEAKAQAKVILDRAALIGKTVNLKLDAIDGPDVDLSKQAKHLTVLIVWSPTSPADLKALSPFGALLPKDTQVVYLALGASRREAAASRDHGPLPGAHCHAVAGRTSRAASDALKLQYSAPPRLYVFDRAGQVSGFGALTDLPRLLGRAGPDLETVARPIQP